MVIDWGAIVNKVPEVALVLVFVWFTLKLVANHSENTTTMMGNWESYLNKQNEKWQKFFEQRDDKFIGSVNELSNQQATFSKQLSTDVREQTSTMKDVVKVLSAQTEILRRIDRAANSRE